MLRLVWANKIRELEMKHKADYKAMWLELKQYATEQEKQLTAGFKGLQKKNLKELKQKRREVLKND